jgi:hypothetical protein
MSDLDVWLRSGSGHQRVDEAIGGCRETVVKILITYRFEPVASQSSADDHHDALMSQSSEFLESPLGDGIGEMMRIDE